MDGPAEGRIEEAWLAPDLVDAVPVDWARRNGVLPLRIGGRKIYAGTPEAPLQAFEDLALLLGEEAEWRRFGEGEIRRAIDRTYFRRAGAATAAAALAEGAAGGGAEGDRRESDDLLSSGGAAPVAQYVNAILLEAVRLGASDIHVEPFADKLAVRYRLDGILYEQPSPPRPLEAPLVARLKVMARMDLAEKRLPQDGVARVRVGSREIDIRVSSVPVAEGERIVLRILHREAANLPLERLGMAEGLLAEWKRLLASPHGIILVTGPTGSGKTTTLYATLGGLDTARLNVLTIEDPIEYQLPGIGQIQVHPKIGLTFASGLRHVLRQDPDVILVGETRDLETAEIVVRASLTGHLVFTTLHTNDAPGAVTRMTDMGIPPYLLASALRAVLAQRLVRRLCPHCREAAEIGAEEAERLGRPELAGRPVFRAHAAGCPACLGGYKGRTGIHELMLATPELAEAIRLNAPVRELAAIAAKGGYRPLAEDGLEKVLAGVTTLSELRRSTGW